MKKLKYIALALLPLSLQALYFGNPGEPQIIDTGFFIPEDSLFSCKLGYQGDWVANRRLKPHQFSSQKTVLFMNQGVATVGVLDRLELSALMGSFSAKISAVDTSSGVLVESQTADSWSVGGSLRLILLQWNKTFLGASIGYQHAKPPVEWSSLNGELASTSGHFLYQEWAAGLGVAHQIDFFIPYLAVQYATVNASLTDLPISTSHTSRYSMRNYEKFSLAIGSTLSSGKRFDLTGEIRFFGEEALSLSGNIKF